MRATMDSTCGRTRLEGFPPLTPVWTVLVLSLFFAPIAGAAGGFVKTSPMSMPRIGHTATLLPNGKVLIAGGDRNTTTDFSQSHDLTNSVELFDPSSGTWKSTGSMNVPRVFHTATLLRNGKVLIAGGCGDTETFTGAELYNPSDGTWAATGSMNVARIYHTATLMPDGKVLVAGGCKVSSTDPPGIKEFYNLFNTNLFSPYAELYDPSNETWTMTGSMGIGRIYHTATLLPDGRVLMAGGSSVYPPWGGIFSGAELYNPSDGTWKPTGAMTVPRTFHTATLLSDGRVLVAGGFGTNGVLSSAELYDPATGKWTATGPLKTSRARHVAALLADGKVLAAGGGKSRSLNAVSDAELYDPAAGKWTGCGSLRTGRIQPTATLLADGRVLIAGGRRVNYELANMLVYMDFDSISKAELFVPTVGPAR